MDIRHDIDEDKLKFLKEEHDKLWREGNKALNMMELVFKQVMDLRKQIEKIEGDDYDPIYLLFNGTFDGGEK